MPSYIFFSQQLLSSIKALQARLVKEAMEKAMLELSIRKEVSEEMSEQMAELENMYRYVRIVFSGMLRSIFLLLFVSCSQSPGTAGRNIKVMGHFGYYVAK